ncbi:MAG TPA: amidohydrolase family protein [Gemmataceae bacterium]|nr:amidohydrolase family protein [Gemmataceae bacterium]
MSEELRLRGKHYTTGERIDVACRDGRIESVTPAGAGKVDHEAQWIAPAFFDLQINGCDGISFNSDALTIEDIRHVVEVCRRHGIAGLCPTLITNSYEALAHGFATLAKACDSDSALNRALPCFHLEGPYISSEEGPRGAHPRAHVRKPDWDEFQRWQGAAGGRVRLVTLAPELEGALPFIETLTASGVVVAVGHTAATNSQIRAAIKAGAKLSTHLGNGAHAMLPRHDNYVWEQLAADELWASIICDGHHLPPAVIRSILRVKTPARTILTCDASSLAGVAPGEYGQWDQKLEVLAEGKIVVSGTPYLAGSWAFTDLCVGIAVRDGGVTLAEAIDMASARPRELLRLPPQRLQAGDRAELILFNWSNQEGTVIRHVT